MNTEAIENSINISGAPKLDGLSFRLLQDERDLPEMVRINETLREAGQFPHVSSLADLSSWFQHPTNCDPTQDVLFALISGKAVGFTRVWWEEEETRPARIYYITLRVLPEWQGSGVDAALLDWAENRLIKIAAQHPAGLERAFSSHLSEKSALQRALLESRGYGQPGDWYRLTTQRTGTSGHKVRIDFDDAEGDLALALYRSDGVLLRLDLLIDEYKQAMVGYMTELQMLDFVV